MKTTDWYPGTVKPAYAGLYERRIDTYSVGYAYWSCAGWGWVHTTPELAYSNRSNLSEVLQAPWRGLTEPHCKHCGTQMVPRAAIQQTRRGVGDFGTIDIVTLSPGGPGKLVACYKCPACGWSMTR